jgi:hypothetical protein
VANEAGFGVGPKTFAMIEAAPKAARARTEFATNTEQRKNEMSHVRYAVIACLVLGLALSFSPVAVGAQKLKAYNAQLSHEFVNAEPTPAHGLVVVLSAESEVSTDADTGAAGIFRNVRGNGSAQITLTNPTDLIDASGGENSKVGLVFRSYKSKLVIKSWWWTDERGKRIGKKQKG